MKKNKKQCDQHLWVRLSLSKGKGSDYHSSTQHLCAAGLRVLYQQLNELEHPSALIKYYTSYLQCTRPEQGEEKKISSPILVLSSGLIPALPINAGTRKGSSWVRLAQRAGVRRGILPLRGSELPFLMLHLSRHSWRCCLWEQRAKLEPLNGISLTGMQLHRFSSYLLFVTCR